MTETVRSLEAERAFAGLEHRDLRPGIDRLGALAGQFGQRAAPELAHDLHAAVRWFERTVEPHLAWEERWLYPELDRLAGTPWATRVARFEHAQLRSFAVRLDAHGRLLQHEPTRQETVALMGDLFALEALLRAHVECEERVLLPLLDETAVAPTV